MIAFKFRTVRGPHYVDVSLFCGEKDKTYQLAGRLKLNPYEWDKLRKTIDAGVDATNDNVHIEVEDAG